jgi:hypothetical protein
VPPLFHTYLARRILLVGSCPTESLCYQANFNSPSVMLSGYLAVEGSDRLKSRLQITALALMLHSVIPISSLSARSAPAWAWW